MDQSTRSHTKEPWKAKEAKNSSGDRAAKESREERGNNKHRKNKEVKEPRTRNQVKDPMDTKGDKESWKHRGTNKSSEDKGVKESKNIKGTKQSSGNFHRVESKGYKICSNIDQLPEELLHEIFDYVPESIVDISMVSKLLRDRVDRYVKRARPIRLLERIDFVCNGQDALVRYFVPIGRAYLFDMRLKHFVIGKVLLWKDIDRSMILQGTGIVRMEHRRYMIKLKNVSPSLPILNACMGGGSVVCSKGRGKIGVINQVSLNLGKDKANHTNVRSILCGFNIRALYCSGSTSDSAFSFITEIVENHNVETLGLAVQKTELSDPLKVLYNLSSKVRALRITQQQTDEIIDNSYLFGIKNGDWGKIIFDLLATDKRLDSLCIENFYYSSWLSASTEDGLERDLKNLGKKVWLDATRKNLNVRAFSNREKEYYVSGGRDNLKIMHISRLGYNFGDLMR